MKKSICPAPCGTRADRVSLHSGRGFITYFDFLFVFYLYKFYYDVAVTMWPFFHCSPSLTASIPRYSFMAMAVLFK